MERANPKSISQTRPASSTMTFCGFKSRWTTPSTCAASRPAANLLKDGHHLAWRKLSAFHQNALQIPPLDVVHRDELASIGAAEIEDPDDVLVRDLAGENQLLLETAENIGMAGQFRADHLEGHQAVQLMIARLVYSAHAAFAQALQDLVALAENHPFFHRAARIGATAAL